MSKPLIQETQIVGAPLVVSHAMPQAQTVALGVFVDVGSRDESEAQAGIAHALEHMLFKGTQSLDVHALSENLDMLGGHANAFTSRERTCFHLHVLYEDWQEALDVLMDMLLEPRLPEAEWLREREVIFSEMGMVDDTPDEWIYDQHMKAIFPNQMLGAPTLGTQESLSAMSTDDLRAYLSSYYRPPQLLIAAAGRISHDDLVDAVSQRDWPHAKARSARIKAQRKAGAQYLSKDMEQAQLVVSFSGIDATSQQRPVAWLANQMLGGGMSSALFREIRERRGLAYSVGSHLSPFSDTGLWSIGCGTPPQRLHDCMLCLKDTIEAFSESLDIADFQRAQRQMEIQFRMAMDSVEGHMLYLGARLDEEVLYSQADWGEKIKQVTLEEVQAWTKLHLHGDAMWSIAGSDEALSSAQKLM